MARSLILAVNAGSSSLKLGLFDSETLEAVDSGSIDWSGGDRAAATHERAVAYLLRNYDLRAIVAVGHRVVQGGIDLRESVLIDERVKRTIHRLEELAPLHNRAALDGIRAIEKLLPDIPGVACFDTAFHATIPPVNERYPVPEVWFEEWGVRRLGFHGLSHAYCAGRAAELLGDPEQLRLVNCHLGQGCSAAAIVDGRSVATTMGFTPLDGLMMGTRSGAIDPGIITYLIEHRGLSADQIDRALNHDSGLLGVSGISGDMRDIQAARDRGDGRAILAFEMFVARLRDGIVTMAAAMGGVDAVSFSGGIGENSPVVRAAVSEQLGWIGVEIDAERNASAHGDADIGAASAPIRLLVLKTQEELMVARETKRVTGVS